jgi:hypothetical protein
MIDEVNALLKTHHQVLRVTQWSGNSVTLSNGTMFIGNERGRLSRRLFNKKTDLWLKKFDELYLHETFTVSQVKSRLAAEGGKEAQRLSGDIIRNNLNTGIPWNKDLKGNYPYSYPCSDGAKEKISEANSGEKNGRYGYVYSDEEISRMSETMSLKILSGEFTPNTNNRNTHWDTMYLGKKYRSSWEALVQHLKPNAKYEELRIRYQLGDKNKIYIVDFIDHVERVVIEVKPSRFRNDDEVVAKLTALKEWSISNNYDLIYADEYWIRSQPQPEDYSLFDEKTASKIKNIYRNINTKTY